MAPEGLRVSAAQAGERRHPNADWGAPAYLLAGNRDDLQEAVDNVHRHLHRFLDQLEANLQRVNVSMTIQGAGKRPRSWLL